MDDLGIPDPGHTGGLSPESSCWPRGALEYYFGGGDRSESSISREFGWDVLIHPDFLPTPPPVRRVDDEFDGESSSLQDHYADFSGGAPSPAVGPFTIGSAGDKSGSGFDASTSSSTEDLPEPSVDSDRILPEPITGSGGSGSGGKVRRRKKGEKRMKQPRVAFMTKSQADNLEDGYRWRKYGQKAVKNSPFPRSYYRCTNTKCTVKKRVERSYEDPSVVITTYEGQHCHYSAAFPRAAAGNHEAAYANSACTLQFIVPNSHHDALLHHPAAIMPFPDRNTSTSTPLIAPQFHDEAPARVEVSQVEPQQHAPNHIDHELPVDHGLLGDIVGVSGSAQPADDDDL